MNEGYRKNPYCIPPDDTYGESCAAFANFQWAHSLFRLTGDAKYIDVAERIMYNVFYASLSLKGDSSSYCNLSQSEPYDYAAGVPTRRSPNLATSCCPPNIIKLFNKIGGFLYSTDSEGVYVKHYCTSESRIPWGRGMLKLAQTTKYPWEGTVVISVMSQTPEVFSLRLRVPDWAKSYRVLVKGKAVDVPVSQGWLTIRRRWMVGDQIELSLGMETVRLTMPRQFAEYQNLTALARGPIVYCLEGQDVKNADADNPWTESLLGTLYVPHDAQFRPEYHPDLLGGITVLSGDVCQVTSRDGDKSIPATFVPYGVWGNRTQGEMRIWLGAHKASVMELDFPQVVLGDSCIG